MTTPAERALLHAMNSEVEKQRLEQEAAERKKQQEQEDED